MNDNSSEDVLAHYGVQGMHWGVRKTYESDPSGKPLSRNKQIHNALVKKSLGKNARKDERSRKTINLGKANTALTLSALGSIALGVVDPEPVSKGVFLVTGILAAIGSVVVSQIEGHSAGDDALNLYGKKS